ncbi:hypothetical protein NVP1084O_140 [Vibrio phage 1.084.O._10N.261.49.F5]|nr:hypothetical protein NVP1084O_140 [Vibrio phage 1.084.O._10N.261.49.F5]
MIEITNFKPEGVSSQWHKSESELLSDEGFHNLKLIFEHLNEHKFCHVRVKGGDYDGSIAKFTLDDTPSGYKEEELYYRVNGRSCGWFNVKYYWDGKLSWKGKRNNPKFTLMSSKCDVLLNYEGDEVLKRFDLKKEGNKLLEQDVFDIDSQKLSIGDEVLYLNLRYGSGGMLCRGTVKAFKAHARDGFVSVIILNNDGKEESECRQPYNQIWKKEE